MRPSGRLAIASASAAFLLLQTPLAFAQAETGTPVSQNVDAAWGYYENLPGTSWQDETGRIVSFRWTQPGEVLAATVYDNGKTIVVNIRRLPDGSLAMDTDMGKFRGRPRSGGSFEWTGKYTDGQSLKTTEVFDGDRITATMSLTGGSKPVNVTMVSTRLSRESAEKAVLNQKNHAKWGPMLRALEGQWYLPDLSDLYTFGTRSQWIEYGRILKVELVSSIESRESRLVTIYSLMPDGVIEARSTDENGSVSRYALQSDGSYLVTSSGSDKVSRKRYVLDLGPPPQIQAISSRQENGAWVDWGKPWRQMALPGSRLMDQIAHERQTRNDRNEDMAAEFAAAEEENRARAASAPNPFQVFTDTFNSEVQQNQRARQGIQNQLGERLAQSAARGRDEAADYADSAPAANSGYAAAAPAAPAPAASRPVAGMRKVIYCLAFAPGGSAVYASQFGSYSQLETEVSQASKAGPGFKDYLTSSGHAITGIPSCYQASSAADHSTFIVSTKRTHAGIPWTETSYTPTVPGRE